MTKILIGNLTHPSFHDIPTFNLHPNNKNTNANYLIYMDGSRHKVGVGAAFIVLDSNKTLIHRQKFKLADYCSNNQTEHLSIYKALQHIQKINRSTHLTFSIYTDSSTALQAITQINNQGYLVHIIRRTYHHIQTTKQHNIELNWIKAHSGNELADDLAKKATSSDQHLSFNRAP